MADLYIQRVMIKGPNIGIYFTTQDITTISDSSGVRLNKLVVSRQETVTSADELGRYLVTNLGVSKQDAITLAEAATLRLKPIIIVAKDTVTLADAGRPSITLTVRGIETITPSDVRRPTLTLPARGVDTVTFSEVHTASPSGGAASFTYVQGWNAANDASSSTIAIVCNGISAGNLLVVWATCENGPASLNTVSDGTNNFEIGAVNGNSALILDQQGWFAYRLIANSGNKTITATWSGASTYRTIQVMEFDYGAETIALDQTDVTAEGLTNGSRVIASGNITTTGTTEVVIGAANSYNSGITSSSETIGGSAAIEPADASPTTTGTAPSFMWYRIATVSNGAAGTTLSDATYWICSVISFKVV